MKVSIHQPETYPQLGYFNKIYNSDLFVFLDDVDYRKNYFQNRNRVVGVSGDIWLTLPVSGGRRIFEKIYDRRSIVKHIKSLMNIYGKGVDQSSLAEIIELSDNKALGRLSIFNISFIKEVCNILDININYMFQSEIKTNHDKSDLILEICKKVSAKKYLSGVSGRDYLNIELFELEGIEILFQEFKYPIYFQKNNLYNKYASVIDCICMNGVAYTSDCIKEGDWKAYENIQR